jgi:hypothetical protein
MHLDGDESHGEKSNLAYGCRSCNGKLSAAFKRAGIGRPTNQYNPASDSIPTLKQYAWAVATHTRGAHDEGGAVIHATPPDVRVEYARAMAGKSQRTKRDRFEERYNPWPFSRPDARKTTPATGGIAYHMKRRKLADDKNAEFLESKTATAGTYKGYKISKTGDGEFFSSLDPQSWYSTKAQAQRAIDGYLKGRSNPAAASAAAFEEFHGFEPSEVVTVSKKIFHHAHLAAAGKLTHLDIWGVDEQGHHVTGFKGAILAFNESKNQLFVEGGDQFVNLEDFGIDSPHELETLGRLTDIGYQTNKTHLGSEGGNAVYVHKFRSTNKAGKHVVVKIARYPDLIYDVRNEQLLFSGGSYEILREGINK